MSLFEGTSGQSHVRDGHSTVVEQGVYVTSHALERLRIHHPRVRGVLCLLAKAEEVEPGFIAPLLGRPLEAVRDRYFLSADGWGVFVLAPARSGGPSMWVLVTYLRFGPYQREVARRLLVAA